MEDADAINPDRIERLADRVLAAARAITARGTRGAFDLNAIRGQFPELNAQRLRDAIKTLIDNGRIYAIGRSVYGISEAFPEPRMVSVSEMTDGYVLLEIGDAVSVALTPEESRRIGRLMAGSAAQSIATERIAGLEAGMRSLAWHLDQLAAPTSRKLRGRHITTSPEDQP